MIARGSHVNSPLDFQLFAAGDAVTGEMFRVTLRWFNRLVLIIYLMSYRVHGSGDG